MQSEGYSCKWKVINLPVNCKVCILFVLDVRYMSALFVSIMFIAGDKGQRNDGKAKFRRLVSGFCMLLLTE